MTTDKKIIKTPDGQPDQVEFKAKVKGGKMKGRTVTVLMDADDAVKDQVDGFINFIRERAVVGLAIGFVAGAQAQAVVKQLIDSFITPTFELIFGSSLKKQKFSIGDTDFGWGMMAYALINLLFVLMAIYILVKVLKLDKLDKQKD